MDFVWSNKKSKYVSPIQHTNSDVPISVIQWSSSVAPVSLTGRFCSAGPICACWTPSLIQWFSNVDTHMSTCFRLNGSPSSVALVSLLQSTSLWFSGSAELPHSLIQSTFLWFGGSLGSVASVSLTQSTSLWFSSSLSNVASISMIHYDSVHVSVIQ